MPGKPTIYLLRHAEKPSYGAGLNAAGVARAEGLVQFFNRRPQYNIKSILAQKPNPNGKRARPRDTMIPLARNLGVTINTDREREETRQIASDVLEYVKQYDAGDVLICWEHKRLRDIAEAIGIKHAPDYDKERYDVLWKIEHPYDHLYVTSYSLGDGLGNTAWLKAG